MGVDVLELHDHQGNDYELLNIVDMGTNFQIVAYLRYVPAGAGEPSSIECADAFLQYAFHGGYLERRLDDQEICSMKTNLPTLVLLVLVWSLSQHIRNELKSVLLARKHLQRQTAANVWRNNS